MKSGAGDLTLAGYDTYTGGTVLAAGTLTLANVNALGTGTLAMEAGTTLGFAGGYTIGNAITVVGDPTFYVPAAQTVTLAGAIGDGTAAGDIVKTGDGTLITTATNTYSGGTTISAGTLQLGNGGTSGSIVGDVLDDGTLAFDRSDDTSFAGVISGSGAIAKLSGDTLTLTGDSSAFTGSTVVTDGTLAVDGDLGGTIAVGSGATLAGSGMVGTVTVASGGTLAPGSASSTGTLSVQGDLALSSGSTYTVKATAVGASDAVHVDGAATLTGATVSVTADGTNWNNETIYTIVNASGGIVGTFAGVSSNLAFLTPTLAYDADDVYLQLARNDISFASIAKTRNELGSANAVNSLGSNSTLYGAVLPLDVATARSALAQLAGDLHPSTVSALVDDSHFARDAVIGRLRSASGTGDAGASTLASQVQHAAPMAVPGRDPVVWTQAFGGWGHTQSDGNASSLGDTTSGVLVGVDAPVSGGWRIGGLAGVSHISLDSSASSANIDSYHFGVYAGNQWGALGLRTGVIGSWHRIDAGRTVAFGAFGERLSSSYDASTSQAFAELGYHASAGPVTLEPYANLAAVNVHTDSFDEHGGAAALDGDSVNRNVLLSTLGLRFSTAFAFGRAGGTLSATLSWRHAFGAVTPDLNEQFAGSDKFTAAGVPIARDAAAIDVGVDFAVARNMTFRLSYSGQLGDRNQQHAMQGRLSWVF